MGAAVVIAGVCKFLLCLLVVVYLVLQQVVAKQSVTQILVKNGLPRGLLPATVSSYTLAENGKFQVNLWTSCTTKIGKEEIYYKKKITGELSYRHIKNLGGIQVHESWFWFSVTDIEVDSIIPNTIWFKIGYFSKAISSDVFQIAPICNMIADEEAEEAKHAMTFSDWLSKALDGKLEVNLPESLNIGAGRKMLQ